MILERWGNDTSGKGEGRGRESGTLIIYTPCLVIAASLRFCHRAIQENLDYRSEIDLADLLDWDRRFLLIHDRPAEEGEGATRRC